MKLRNNRTTTIKGMVSMLVATAALASMAFAQGGGRPPKEFQFAPPPDSKLALLLRNDVAAEIHLTESQKEEVKSAVQKSLEPPRGMGMPGGMGGGFPGGGMPGGGGFPPDGEFPGGGFPGGGMPGGGMPGGGFPGGEMPSEEKIQQMIQSRMDGAAKKILKKLKPEQSQRFQQIYLQVRGNMALLDKEVRSSLKTTKAQNKQLATIETDFRLALGEARPSPDRRALPAPEMARKMETLQIRFEARISDVLTDAQKEALKSRLGERFTPNPGLGSYFTFQPPE